MQADDTDWRDGGYLVNRFTETTPTRENVWRSIILFGLNVASYKFAFGKSLLELADQDRTAGCSV
jgi:hypothetical protein